MNLSTTHTGRCIATQLACKQQLCLYWSPDYTRQRSGERFPSHISSVCRSCSSSMLLFHTHLPAVLSCRSLRAPYRGRWWKKAVKHPSLMYLHFQALPEVNCWALNTLVTTSRGLVLPSLKQCCVLWEVKFLQFTCIQLCYYLMLTNCLTCALWQVCCRPELSWVAMRGCYGLIGLFFRMAPDCGTA